jgi:MOSC domain
VTEFALPAGPFFDVAVVHLLTTATINRLRALNPQGRFEARRFRPNIVVSTPGEDAGFVEDDWVGRSLIIGGSVRLAITGPCPRCVMVTLPQGDLPRTQESCALPPSTIVCMSACTPRSSAAAPSAAAIRWHSREKRACGVAMLASAHPRPLGVEAGSVGVSVELDAGAPDRADVAGGDGVPATAHLDARSTCVTLLAYASRGGRLLIPPRRFPPPGT